MRVDPIGKDARGATYWYFFGTRLYRDDAPLKVRTSLDPVNHPSRTFTTVRGWNLVCRTSDDWSKLVTQFEKSTHHDEVALHCTLIDDFLPNIQSMFVQQEQLRRKKLVFFF